MIPKASKLYSVVHGTCPRCHEGQVFKNKNPYKGLQFAQMNSACSHCGQSFDPEPGFYQGAMYVSYALTLGICFVVGIALILLYNVSMLILMSLLTVILLVLVPIVFRLSRLIWLNFFIRYRPQNPREVKY